MHTVQTAAAASPLGHYSQAVVKDGFVFVSGILPIEPDGPIEPGRSFSVQADCVMRNARAILAEAGSDLSRIVKATIYVTDIDNWAEFNRVYAAHLGDHRPARSVAPVPVLHHGFAVELELIAGL